jgi:hypothetical protein
MQNAKEKSGLEQKANEGNEGGFSAFVSFVIFCSKFIAIILHESLFIWQFSFP